MTDLPNSKISDEEMDELVKLFRAGHAAVPARATPDERVRAGLAVALVASGWRPEADVLREAADRIDPGPASTRRPALNDLDDMQMTCDRGVATRLRTWADIRERYRATALEPVGALPVAEAEGQERSDGERCPNCAPGYNCERGIYEPVSSTGEEPTDGE